MTSRETPVRCTAGVYQIVPSSTFRCSGWFAIMLAQPIGTPVARARTVNTRASATRSRPASHAPSAAASANGPPAIQRQISASASYAA